MGDLPGWERDDHSIHKTYQFDEFSSAARFAGRVAAAAEATRPPTQYPHPWSTDHLGAHPERHRHVDS
jgi:Pterin 4 alpha carbinolamine dehydratase